MKKAKKSKKQRDHENMLCLANTRRKKVIMQKHGQKREGKGKASSCVDYTKCKNSNKRKKQKDKPMSEVFFRQPFFFLINIESGKCTAQQLLGKPITTYKHLSDTIKKLENLKMVIRDQSKKQWGGKIIYLTPKGVKFQKRFKEILRYL